MNVFYKRGFADAIFDLFVGFIFAVLIVVAVVVVELNGGLSRDTLTGKVLEIEERQTI